MKIVFGAVLCTALVASGLAIDASSNPLGKVFELMSALEAKIVKEGEAEAKAFKEFFEWCDDASKNINYDIKTAKAKQEKLTAKIGELSSDIEVAESKIDSSLHQSPQARPNWKTLHRSGKRRQLILQRLKRNSSRLWTRSIEL
jgi:hypothetical protein